MPMLKATEIVTLILSNLMNLKKFWPWNRRLSWEKSWKNRLPRNCNRLYERMYNIINAERKLFSLYPNMGLCFARNRSSRWYSSLDLFPNDSSSFHYHPYPSSSILHVRRKGLSGYFHLQSQTNDSKRSIKCYC